MAQLAFFNSPPRLRSVPFLHVQRAVSGKLIWEQVAGKPVGRDVGDRPKLAGCLAEPSQSRKW